MAPTNHGLIKEGDWVSGTSVMDEKFIGFVYSLEEEGFLKVFVTQCDREKTVSNIVSANISKVKSLPVLAPSSPEEVRSLIELALMTHDKAWFIELQANLTAPSPTADSRIENRTGQDFFNPRLFGIAPKDPMDV